MDERRRLAPGARAALDARVKAGMAATAAAAQRMLATRARLYQLADSRGPVGRP